MAGQVLVMCIDENTGKKVIQPITKTGTYVGDGTDSNSIDKLGFTPKFVEISEKEAVSGQSIDIFTTTNEIIDDVAEGMALIHRSGDTPPHSTISNRISSLDADGFTVDDDGSDQHPNKDGVTYNYRATI